MTSMRSIFAHIAAAAAVIGLSLPAHAQVPPDLPPADPPPPTRAALESMIDAALPSVVGTQDLITELRQARFGTPLIQAFDLETAVAAVFGGQSPVFAPSCSQLVTPSGDRDWGDCTASVGQRNGSGAYTELQFSKNMQIGNVKFFKRPADIIIDPRTIRPVQMDDPTAYNTTVSFLRTTFGLSNLDIPPPPPGATLPVRNIVLGWAQSPQGFNQVPVQKLVVIKRGARLPNGIVIEGRQVRWLRAPGDARAVIDANNVVVHAQIRGWQQVGHRSGTYVVKNRARMIDEIADRIQSESQGPIATINAQIELGAVGVDDEVWNQPVYGVVRLSIAPLPRDLDEPLQGLQATTGAYEQTFALVDFGEASHD